jgi:hypothetical protein
MVRHAVLMYDASDFEAPPVPVSQSGYNWEDVVNRVTEAVSDPGNLWFGWTPAVDPFPFEPSN